MSNEEISNKDAADAGGLSMDAEAARAIRRAVRYLEENDCTGPAADLKALLDRPPAVMAGGLSKLEAYTLRRVVECCEELSKRPRPMCRDCADENGTCPNSGLECDMRKLFTDARALMARLTAAGAA